MDSMDLQKVFLIGGTGFVGGTVLSRLLGHPGFGSSFQVSALVRSPQKASILKSIVGLTPIVGSYENLGLVKSLTEDADIVIECADSDDLPAAKAILEGMKVRHERTGRKPSLIHTSGTGVLQDDAQGMHTSEDIYSDLDLKKIESLAPSQPHREVDTTIVRADEQGYVNTYLVLPPTIYGIASGRLVDLGVQNPRSQQIPRLVQLSLARGKAGYIGLGKNKWGNVHIDDLGDFYFLLFSAILSDSASHLGHGKSGYYFTENGEHEMLTLATRLAQIMHAQGKSSTPKPVAFDAKEMKEIFPNGTSLGTNSRSRAERGRKHLGEGGVDWKPRKGTEDLLESLNAEIDAEL